DVVGVHQQGGAHTVGGDLCAEGSFLIGSAVWVGVQQRPGVGSGAGCWDVVAERRLKVGGGVETCEVGGTGARHRGVFVRAAAAHLDDGAAVGSGDHAGSRGGHGGVRVEDGEDHRLQDHALGEGATHGEDRGVREVDFALQVAIHLPAEAVVAQVLQGFGLQEVQIFQLGLGEDEVPDRAENTLGAGKIGRASC